MGVDDMVNGDYKFVCVRACVCFVFVVLLLLLLLVFSGLLLVSCGSFVFDTVVYYRLITAYGPVSLSPFSHAGSRNRTLCTAASDCHADKVYRF